VINREQVRITTPCDVEWDALERRPRGRFCGQCQTLVTDLSAMSERDARALLAQTEQAVCLRYLHDATGQVHFADGPRLVPTSRLRAARRASGVAALMAPLLFQACGGADPVADWQALEDAGVAGSGGAQRVIPSFSEASPEPRSTVEASKPSSQIADAGAPPRAEDEPSLQVAEGPAPLAGENAGRRRRGR